MTKATTRQQTEATSAGNVEGQSAPRPVHAVWADVMGEAQSLGKNQRFGDGDQGGPKFAYRGIDDTMNLVGPILRKYRVMIVPKVLHAGYRDITTQTNQGSKTSREVTVTVEYTIIGPAGDTIVGSASGESLDRGDKGTAKAMSVAFRVFLLQALCLPTNEPDPDSQVYERSGRKTPEQIAQEVADRLVSDNPVLAVVQNVKSWSAEQAVLDIGVTDPEGNQRPLIQLLDAKLEELAAADPAAQAAKQAQVDRALGGEQPSEA